ncbi:MAG: 3-dehydroquinate synthase [Planctomycetota bacterium]|nr:3-dehydroquinate synthase [Planctomycetota bacterium]MDA1213827.1 3-dehydroquinate synthase [Planctomycetota bacterium]
MNNLPADDQLDISFAVPFVHRLRFTQDIFGVDQTVLWDLLESSGDQTIRVQVWLDEHVAKAQPGLKRQIAALLKSGAPRVQLTGNIQMVPGGEEVKNEIHILERMLKCMNHADLDRRSYVIVIGGGAVLDAVGFAAAIAHRGIRLIRLPTTTLAQADSGIGVKNAVNLFGKKNWVGSFAVPWGVINDASLLATLPDRDFIGGFSEAVKVSLLKDPAMFQSLCESAREVRARNMTVAEPLIRASAEWHLKHITAGGDPFEALEARPLDFGHWSAHKLEVMTNFELRHGEAVAIGVGIDTVYSSLIYGLPISTAEQVLDCLQEMGLPLSHPILDDHQTLFKGLEEFRQHLGGRLTLTMLQEVGRPINVHEVDLKVMAKAIEAVQQRGKTASTKKSKRSACQS